MVETLTNRGKEKETTPKEHAIVVVGAIGLLRQTRKKYLKMKNISLKSFPEPQPHFNPHFISRPGVRILREIHVQYLRIVRHSSHTHVCPCQHTPLTLWNAER